MCKPNPEKSVNALETLCLNQIAENMWYIHGMPSNLVRLAILASKLKKKNVCFKNVLKYGKQEFQDCLESILNKILAMDHYPYKLKIMIALRLISLEEHVSKSILELTSKLKKPNIPNICYCIANAVILDNKLDKVQTLHNILFTSYFGVKLNTNKIAKFCNIDVQDLENIYQYLRINKSFANTKKTLRRAEEMVYKTNNWEYVWFEEVMNAYSGNWQNFKFVNKQLLDFIAVNGPLEILELQYKKLKRTNRESVVSRALISALLCDQDVKENIIFLFEKLKSETKKKIFMRYHKLIFGKLFMSYCGNFCFEVFTEMYRNNKCDICIDIFYNALCLLTSPTLGVQYCYDVLYTTGKNIIFNMWKTLLDSDKVKLGDKFYMMLDQSTDIKDFSILSLLMTDPTFDDKQKFEHRVYVMSKIVLESSVDETEEIPLGEAFEKLENLEKCEPDANLAWIKINMDSELLKQLILAADCPYIKALNIFFENETVEKCLKNELLADIAFMHKALIKISEFEEENVTEFLDWIFSEDKMSADRYVQQNVVPHLVDIYKSYVLQSRCPSSFPFRQLNVTEEDEGNIKAIVREDTELIAKLFAKYLSPEQWDILSPCVRLCCGNTSLLFKAIYNDDVSDEEKHQLIEYHLISENGLDSIYKMFESNFYSVRLYLNNPCNSPVGTGFVDTMTYYCDFSKSWLNDDRQLLNALLNALNKRGHPNTLKSNKDCNVKHLLLPFESVRDNRMIVDTNYRMFRTIIQFKTDRLESILAYIKKDSKKISSLTHYSEDIRNIFGF